MSKYIVDNGLQLQGLNLKEPLRVKISLYNIEETGIGPLPYLFKGLYGENLIKFIVKLKTGTHEALHCFSYQLNSHFSFPATDSPLTASCSCVQFPQHIPFIPCDLLLPFDLRSRIVTKELSPGCLVLCPHQYVSLSKVLHHIRSKTNGYWDTV